MSSPTLFKLHIASCPQGCLLKNGIWGEWDTEKDRTAEHNARFMCADNGTLKRKTESDRQRESFTKARRDNSADPLQPRSLRGQAVAMEMPLALPKGDKSVWIRGRLRRKIESGGGGGSERVGCRWMAIYCKPPQSEATQKDIADELNQIWEDSLLATIYVYSSC